MTTGLLLLLCGGLLFLLGILLGILLAAWEMAGYFKSKGVSLETVVSDLEKLWKL